MARYRGLICDLDGTVYLSGRPLPGAVEALARLRADGVRVLFVSNNPLRDAASYAERLTGLGVPATPDDVLTSGAVTAEWIRGNVPGARVLMLGESSLAAELTERGGAKLVVRGEDADVVVASFDRTFTYSTWVEAFRAIRAGAQFVATNPDPTCPVEGGEVPDCGGIIAALETSTGRKVEHVMGKPSPAMLVAALNRLRLSPSDVLIAGDRLETDIALGSAGSAAPAGTPGSPGAAGAVGTDGAAEAVGQAGAAADAAGAGGVYGRVDTALVLTGITSREMLDGATRRPTYVVESLADLPGICGIA